MIGEKEFKKLPGNSRDWLIYQLLSERSKERVEKEMGGEKELERNGDNGLESRKTDQTNDSKPPIVSEHVSGVNIEKEIGVNIDVIEALLPEAVNVQETIQGIVRIVTKLAVQIVVGIKATWIPKSAIKNVSSVVLEQGKPVSVELRSWYVPKVVWRVI